MARAVPQILRYYFRPAKRPRTIPISNENIQASWLPKIKNINFVIAPEERLGDYENGGFVFLEPKGEGDKFSVDFGRFNPQEGGIGDTWNVRRRGGRFHVWRSRYGWGSSGMDSGLRPVSD